MLEIKQGWTTESSTPNKKKRNTQKKKTLNPEFILPKEKTLDMDSLQEKKVAHSVQPEKFEIHKDVLHYINNLEMLVIKNRQKIANERKHFTQILANIAQYFDHKGVSHAALEEYINSIAGQIQSELELESEMKHFYKFVDQVKKPQSHSNFNGHTDKLQVQNKESQQITQQNKQPKQIKGINNANPPLQNVIKLSLNDNHNSLSVSQPQQKINLQSDDKQQQEKKKKRKQSQLPPNNDNNNLNQTNLNSQSLVNPKSNQTPELDKNQNQNQNQNQINNNNNNIKINSANQTNQQQKPIQHQKQGQNNGEEPKQRKKRKKEDAIDVEKVKPLIQNIQNQGNDYFNQARKQFQIQQIPQIPFFLENNKLLQQMLQQQQGHQNQQQQQPQQQSLQQPNPPLIIQQQIITDLQEQKYLQNQQEIINQNIQLGNVFKRDNQFNMIPQTLNILRQIPQDLDQKKNNINSNFQPQNNEQQ